MGRVRQDHKERRLANRLALIHATWPMSGNGPSATSLDEPGVSAFGVEAVVQQTSAEVRDPMYGHMGTAVGIARGYAFGEGGSPGCHNHFCVCLKYLRSGGA